MRRSARSSSLNPAISESLSRVSVCSRVGGSSHKHGRSASPVAASCGDSWYHQAVRQRKSSRRCSPTDAHTCTCWIVRPQTARNPFGQADRSGSCSGSGAASSVFFGPGSQQSGYEAGFGAALALLAGNDAVAAGQGIRQCPGNSSQGYKYSGADAFCQGKMDGRARPAPSGCLVFDTANSTRIPSCPLNFCSP